MTSQISLREVGKFNEFFLSLLPEFRTRKREIFEKPGGELVTNVDLGIQEKIKEFLNIHFPGYPVVSEEDNAQWPPQQHTFWLVDPLDGTHNFLMGLPTFGAMLALIEHGMVVASFIFLPVQQEREGQGLYFALKGKGAYLYGETGLTSLSASEESNLGQSTLLVEGPSREVLRSPHFMILARRVQRFRNISCSAWSATRLVSNDISIQPSSLLIISNKPTDNLPCCLLIEEAGGKVSDLQGNPYALENCSTLVCSNSVLHPEIVRLVTRG